MSFRKQRMRRSGISVAPVVTLLSSSPALSRRAQAAMKALFCIEPRNVSIENHDDTLNSILSLPLFGSLNKQWDSVVSECLTSGTIMHFLSVKRKSETSVKHSLAILSLIGSGGPIIESVKESRILLAECMSRNALKLSAKQLLGQQLQAFDILGINGGLPFLRPADCESLATDVESINSKKQGLKEIAIPHSDDAVYPDGRTFLSTLSESSLHRPVVGLYQFKKGLAVRPLPTGTDDHFIPTPSFVFKCENMKESISIMRSKGVVTAKIGFSGTSQRGQIMVHHPDIPGLDLRLTDSIVHSSSFSESQEALLAGSLDGLQSENVLLEGGAEGREKAKSDPMTGVGDCWVEFRATMKQPSGFFKNGSKGRLRTAKAPDLPYK